eukprot:GEMP01042058.1.p1 GENE.GEMP01042058.1~~GEMP01042058.1.p1  ORF type:complete len:329 (+),score=37.90 GEMP01042058.1:126-989(+)
MRQSSTLPSPNYKDYKDHDLRKHGSPDLVLLVQGHKLYVHAEKLTVYSPVLYNKLQKLDPIWGKMVQLQGRTVAGVTALLDAIYPPQRMPEAIHFDEVYALSKELKMELLIQKLKLGIIKNCSLCPLLVAQEHEKSPDVVFDAFAEFTLNDLKLLDEFDKLSAETRFEVARRRAEVLERQLRHDIMEKVYTQAKARLFRICPTPKLDSDTDGINRFTSAVHLRWSLHSMSQQRLEQLNATKRTSEFRRREVYGRRRSTCAEILTEREGKELRPLTNYCPPTQRTSTL